MTLAVGERIGGRFEVEALLGEGGTARVYRVRHMALGSVLAVKFLAPGSGGSLARLLQEGQIQARLRHPCIVSVIDVVEYQGMTGLLMEYVQGPSLADVLAQGKVSQEETLELFARILAGVGAAHRFGVLHRDLKPHNVLLEPHTGGWLPKVADFGIARAVNATAASRQTRDGFGVGTPGYMAPEVVWGTLDTDVRADMYGLGIMLFELLTGELPVSPRPGLAPPNPAAAGVALGGGVLGSAVERALDPDPDDRLASVEELAQALYGDRPDLLAIATGAAVPTPVALSGEFIARAPIGEDISGGTLVADELGPREPPPALLAPPEAAPPNTSVTFEVPTGEGFARDAAPSTPDDAAPAPSATTGETRSAAAPPASEQPVPEGPPARPWGLIGGVLLAGVAAAAAFVWLQAGKEPAPSEPPAEPTASGAVAANDPVASEPPTPEAAAAQSVVPASPEAYLTPPSPGAASLAPGLPGTASPASTAGSSPQAPKPGELPTSPPPGAPLGKPVAAAEPTIGAPAPSPSKTPSGAAPEDSPAPVAVAMEASAEPPTPVAAPVLSASAPEAALLPDVRGRYSGTAAGRPLQLRIVSQPDGRLVADVTILLGPTERSARYTGTVSADGRLSLSEDGGSGRLDLRLSGNDLSGTFSSGGGKPLPVKASKNG